MNRFCGARACALFLLTLAWAANAAPPGVQVTGFSQAPAGVSVSWRGPTNGWLFTVESQPSLAGAWSPVSGPAWPVATNQWTGPAAGSAGFFRVTASPAPVDRGAVLLSTNLGVFPAALIDKLAALEGISITVTQAVTVYRLDYQTIDPYGAGAVASGLLAVPQILTQPRPLLTYLHGTSVLKTDVPSQLNTEGLLALGFAASGYVAALPDYLGLGDSPGLHPYLHADSEASAAVDFLRAARRFGAAKGIPFNGQVFICGYSQGGHSALATLREIEAHETNEFSVTACAAGSGPYDLSATTANYALSGVAQPNPYQYGYLVAAYQDVYGLTNSVADLLRSPYDVELPPLFDGFHDSPEINAVMPAQPLEVLTPDYLADFAADPTNPLRAALRDNDLIRWIPRAPLHLFACSGDQDVPPANAVVAQAAFAMLGDKDVIVSDPSPGSDHDGCAVPAIFAAKAWFDTLVR